MIKQIMNDVSNRTRNKEILNNPEIFFRQVIENAGGVPFQLIFGPKFGTGYYKYVGIGIKDLLGIPPSELTEKLFNSLVEEVNPLLTEIPIDPEECRLKMVKGDIPRYKADVRIRTKNGEVKWINDSSLPIRDEKTGKIIGAQGILIDINERKRIEKDSEQNISLLRATLDSTADGILVVDSSGKISDFNDRFAQMWRIPDTILATHADNQVIQFVLSQIKDPEGFLSKVKGLYGNPEVDSYDILEFKDGRYFECFSQPQRIKGKPVGRVWSFRDVTDRKHSEKSLKESEEQFRTLADQSPNMIFINHKGKVVYANKKCEEIMGYSVSEFLSPDFNFRKLIAPESLPIIETAFAAHSQGKDVPPYEYHLLTKEGKNIYAIITTKLIKYQNENAIPGIVTDITERKRAEEALKESEKRFRLFEEVTSEGIVIHEKGIILDVNQSFAAMSGYELREIIGKNILQFAAPESKEIVKHNASIGYDKPYEVIGIKKNGTKFPVELLGRNFQFEGRTLRVTAVRDLTERKRIEEKLRNSEITYRGILNSVEEAIYIHDKDGRFIYVNDGAVKMYGYDREFFIGKTPADLSAPGKNDMAAIAKLIEKAFKGEPQTLEFWGMHKNGRVFPKEVHLYPGKYFGENVLVAIAYDITDRKRAEELLVSSERSYKGLFNSLGDAIYVQDNEGKFLDVNDGAVEMYGYPREYFIGKIPEFLSAPGKNDLNATMETIQRAFAGEPQQFEWWGIRKNGEIFPKDVRLTKGFYLGKDAIIAIARDITERKRAEIVLQENEKRYRILFEGANDAIFIMGEDKFIECNDMTLRMFGCDKKEDIIGHSPWDFSPFQQPDGIDSRKKALKVIQAAMEGIPQRFYWKHNRKDKSLFDAEVSLNRIELGGKIFLQALVRDMTERFQAEKALAESEERYHSLFDRMMDGVYRSTHDGKFADVNDAMVKMFGFSSKEDMLNVDIKKELYFSPSERDSLFLDTGEERIEVFRMRRIDGSEIWVEDHGHYVKDEKGNIISHEGILRNITERMRNEVLQNAIYQISQSPEKTFTLDDLYKSVHQIISTVMPAKNFYISLYDEERDLLTFPYFVDEVDITPPPINPGKGLTAYVLRTGRPLLCDEATDMKLRQQGEVELIGAPSSIWLGVPLIVANKTIGVMVVQHYSDPHAYNEQDLHMLEYVSSQVAKAIEHKRSEDKLRQSEEQFRLISENVADLIAVLDLNGKRLYSSPSYNEILGDPKSLYGTDSFQEIHPEDRERIKQIFQETVKTGVGQRAEYRFLLKDGRIRHIESQGSIIKDKDGKISQVVVVSRDVTEKKILEQQFLRSQRMESIGTLAGGIAHDLNNVLAPIVMAIDILKKKATDKTSLHILDTLEASAQRGADIVKQVLAFARGIEGERILLQPKHIIGDIVKIIKETFPRLIDIQTEVPKTLWTISADPTQIHQVLLNVCVNARDAMTDGGKLTITAENIFIDENYSKMHAEAKAGPTIMITISDTGMGIPPKILDKIFEPFFTTKEIGKGTGLGLSTVHAIMKSHGGFTNVYSEVAKGTTFKIYFPASMKDQASSAELLQPILPQGNGELILIVDDEASIRDITKSTLEANGYYVMTANDGTEAISLYAQNREIIKVVISDIMMPVMDGMVTIRALQKMNPNIKIIAASGLITSDVKNLGAQVQASLTKPFSAEKLLTTLHKVLSS
ncbi:MAG: PAS domain S-box protein [Bacteroidota bacterium]|nr:PAS domain S-box protein [Bacteroidota bacterium]